MKVHLRRPNLIIGKSGVICGQRSVMPLRKTNVDKTESCKKCQRIRYNRDRKSAIAEGRAR